MDKETIKIFGEFHPFKEGCGHSKFYAKDYLINWKKNLLYKLNRDSVYAEIVNEQWVEREAKYSDVLCQNATLALKLSIKSIWNHELK